MEPDGTGIWRELVSDFNRRHPRSPVTMVEGPPATNAREDLYSTSFLSGAGSYDIVHCDVIWVAKFAAAGWLRDLTGDLTPEDRADFLEADLQAGYYDGKLYRFPAFTDAGVLYYRTDLVADPPRTFEELTRQSLRLQTADRWGFLWQGKQYEGLVTVFLEVLWGFGGEWIDPSARTVHLDEAPALRALEFLKDTVGVISPPGVTGYSEEDTRILFQGGRAVFMRNWPYVWTLARRSGGLPGGRTGFTRMVHSPGNSSAATLGGFGFAVSALSDAPEEALDFVRFITRPEQLKRVQERVGLLPARKSLLPQEFAPIMSAARNRPPIPEYAQASDILQRRLSAALTGRMDAVRALREAARETRLLLGERRDGR